MNVVDDIRCLLLFSSVKYSWSSFLLLARERSSERVIRPVGTTEPLLHFLNTSGLWGEIFLLFDGLGLALGRAASYSSFQETDSDFSTTSNTLGESGPAAKDLKIEG